MNYIKDIDKLTDHTEFNMKFVATWKPCEHKNRIAKRRWFLKRIYCKDCKKYFTIKQILLLKLCQKK